MREAYSGSIQRSVVRRLSTVSWSPGYQAICAYHSRFHHMDGNPNWWSDVNADIALISEFAHLNGVFSPLLYLNTCAIINVTAVRIWTCWFLLFFFRWNMKDVLFSHLLCHIIRGKWLFATTFAVFWCNSGMKYWWNCWIEQTDNNSLFSLNLVGSWNNMELRQGCWKIKPLLNKVFALSVQGDTVLRF